MLAIERVPFDDEWFSLTLVSEASLEGFWGSLARDMHPPWLAMLDRWLWGLAPSRASLVGVRILCVLAAAALWLVLLRPVAGRRTWVFGLALLHPIVFYYMGAQRWYPVLMLGHALRHWAILSASTDGRRAGAFIGGAILGMASGYVDLLFLTHDAGHYAWRERRRPKLAAWVLSASVLVAVVLVVGSPIASEHWEIFTRQASRDWPALNTLLWGGLGPVGEALPHAAFLLLGLVVVSAALLGGGTLVRAGLPPQTAWLVASLIGCWLVATRFGVSSPRYSLEVWWLMAVAVLAPLACAEGRRLWAGLGAAAMLLGLLCTLSGEMFFKADLNTPPATFCADVAGEQGVDAYVIPYHRIAEQLRLNCAPEADIVVPPAMRHVTSRDELLGRVQARIAQGGRLTLLATTSRASIRRTRAAVRALLDGQCSVLGAGALWPPPHLWIREHLIESPSHRLIATRYDCP